MRRGHSHERTAIHILRRRYLHLLLLLLFSSPLFLLFMGIPGVGAENAIIAMDRTRDKRASGLSFMERP